MTATLTDKEQLDILWGLLADDDYWTYVSRSETTLIIVETDGDGNPDGASFEFEGTTREEAIIKFRAWQVKQRLTK